GSCVKPASNRLTVPAWLLVSSLALAVSGCGGGDSADSTPPVATPPVVTPPVATPPPTETPPPAGDLPEPELEAAPSADVKPLPKPGAPSLSPPPAELRLSAAYNKSAAAAPVLAVSASSSGDENGNNT